MLLCSLKNSKEVRFSKRPLVHFDLCGPVIYLFWNEGSCAVQVSFRFALPKPFKSWDSRCALACSVGVVMGTVHASQELSCTPIPGIPNFPCVPVSVACHAVEGTFSYMFCIFLLDPNLR